MMPFVMIMDPKKVLPMKKQKDVNDPLKVKQEQPLENGSYMFKTSQMIFPNDVSTELQKLVDQFIDDDLNMIY